MRSWDYMQKKVFAFFITILFIMCPSCGKKYDSAQDLQDATISANNYLGGHYDNYSINEIASTSPNTFLVSFVASNYGTIFETNVEGSFYLSRINEGWYLLEGSSGIDYKSRSVQLNKDFDDYYYYSKRNTYELFKITKIDGGSVTVTIYGYYIGNWGRDETYKSTESWPISFDQDMKWFEFSYNDIGFDRQYRVYSDHIESGEYHTHIATGEETLKFSKDYPVNPNNYWWFKELN